MKKMLLDIACAAQTMATVDDVVGCINVFSVCGATPINVMGRPNPSARNTDEKRRRRQESGFVKLFRGARKYWRLSLNHRAKVVSGYVSREAGQLDLAMDLGRRD
jgi:hypothetical protein